MNILGYINNRFRELRETLFKDIPMDKRTHVIASATQTTEFIDLVNNLRQRIEKESPAKPEDVVEASIPDVEKICWKVWREWQPKLQSAA